MQAKLNTTTIKKLEPKAAPYEVVDTEIKGFLLRVQPTGRKTYYYSYRGPSGARKRIKIGVVSPELTPAQARDEATVKAGEVTKGVDVQREKVVAKVEAQEARLRTLKIFLADQYTPWVLVNLKTGQATLDRINYHFSDFMRLAIEDISVRRVESWRIKAQKQGLKPATINRTVNCLRGVLTKAVEWGLLEKHPLEKLRPLKIDKTPKARFLSDDEQERLYVALRARDMEMKAARVRGNKHRAERGHPPLSNLAEMNYADRMLPMITLSLKTGLRRGELFDLMVADVDLKAKIITVRGEGAKSGHTRHLPLSPKALEVMAAWMGDLDCESTRVFPSGDGGRLDNVRKSWTTILAGANISKFRWHDMRHDFASRLVMRGVPLNTVRELCGHSDLNTTLRYAHLAPDHKAQAMAVID